MTLAKIEDFSHVTKSLYEQNLELTERNKTLSILQRINSIILSSATDIQQIAGQIANLIVKEADEKIVGLFLRDKSTIKRVSFAVASSLDDFKNDMDAYFFKENIPLSDSGFLATAIREKKSIIVPNFVSLVPQFPEEKAHTIQTIGEITQAAIYPIITHEEVIGAFIVSRREVTDALKAYTEDLINRLVSMIGIALNNALLYQDIQQANQELKHLDKLKDEFVSLVSHELRTPLTTVKGFLSVVMDETKDTMDEEHKQMLKMAYGSTDRLIKLVNDMLDVSRIESGKLTINQTKLNLTDLVKNCIAELQPVSTKQKITVALDDKSDIAHYVSADPDKTKEVIINLVNNALKFTPQGGSVTLSCKEDQGMIITTVKDTGRGITPEDLTKLFGKFTRLEENANQPKIEGTGLGLYISKAIVEAQGGRIWVTSEGRNMGTTFYFSLQKAN